MKNKKTISIVFIVVSIVLAIISVVLLPEVVIIQFSLGTSGNSTAPKLLMIFISTAFGVGGSISSLLGTKEKTAEKGLLISLVGIGLSIMTLIVNTMMK